MKGSTPRLGSLVAAFDRYPAENGSSGRVGPASALDLYEIIIEVSVICRPTKRLKPGVTRWHRNFHLDEKGRSNHLHQQPADLRDGLRGGLGGGAQFRETEWLGDELARLFGADDDRELHKHILNDRGPTRNRRRSRRGRPRKARPRDLSGSNACHAALAQHRRSARPGPANRRRYSAAAPLKAAARERRLSWAVLLKRTWGLDVLLCPRCSGPMRLIAAIEDPAVARRILVHLGLPARAPVGAWSSPLF
jgi:hypothetical protein